MGYTQFSWVEMFKNDLGDINRVKCIVCLDVKGKDVILCLKFDMLEKHAERQKQFKICHIWERRK